MRRFALIYNPKAKRNRKFPWRMYRYRSIVKPVGDFIVSENLTHLEEVIADLRRRECEIVGICGGDGSIQKTITTVIHEWKGRPLPLFALVKGGTMNTIITALGLRGMGRSYLRALVHKLRHDEPIDSVERPMLKVNEHFAFMFGLGFATKLMSVYYKGGGGARTVMSIIGRGALSVATGSEFARWIAEPFEAAVQVDGRPVAEKHFTALLAGTITRYPLGFLLVPRALEKPHHFHLRLASFPLPYYFRFLYRLHRGMPIPDDRFWEHITQKVEIETPQEQPLILDGEMLTAGTKLNVELGPSLSFVSP